MKKNNEKICKNDAYCHFRHVIGSTTRWSLLFFCIFLGFISALFLRLQQAPIPLKPYQKYIESLISSDDLKITLDNPILALDKSKTFAPQIKADKLDITLNESHYHFENIALNFSDTAILKLNIRPHSVTAEKTNLLTSLSNEKNNSFSLKSLYKQQFKKGFLSNLDHIRISKTSFALMGDDTYLKTLKLHDGTLELHHDADLETLTLRALGQIETDYFTQNAALETVYDKEKELVTTGINLQNLDATSYNILGFNGKADVKIRISQDDHLGLLGATLQAKSSGGKFNFENSKHYPDVAVKKMDISAQYYLRDKKMTFQIHNLTTNKGFAKGSLVAKQNSEDQIHFAFLGKLHGFNYAGLFERPVTFERLHLEGALNKSTQKAHFSKMRISAEKANFTGTAQFTEKKDGAFDITSHLQIENITEKNLTKLWPLKAPGQARYWLKENMLRTTMTGGTLHLAYKSTDQFPKINLRLPFSKNDFYYRKPMPPARNTAGIMTLRNKKLRFDMRDGTINNIDITKGYFEIPDIVAQIPLGKTQLFLDGHTSDLLYILDQEPLNIMTPRNILYANKKGRFSGDVTFELPLLSTVTFDDVKVKGDVTIKDGAAALQNGKYNISNYNGDLSFTEKGLESDFTATINSVNAAGHWKENFDHSLPLSTDIKAKGTVTEKSLLNFGINITDYWKGSAQTDFKLQLSKGEISHISAKANASDSVFMIPYSTFSDPKGNKKIVTLEGKESDGTLILDHIHIKSPETDLTIENLKAKNGLRAFDISALNAGDIVKNAAGTYRHKEGERPTLHLQSDYLDAEQFINYDPKRPAASAPPLEWTQIKANIAAKKVRINKKKIIEKLQINAISPADNPYKMDVIAKINKSGRIEAKIKTLSNSKKDFSFTAYDAGAFLNAYDSFYHYKKGLLKAKGTIHKTQQGVPATIKGQMHILDGAVENAPTVAKIFSVASITGITDRLGKGNLSMDKIEADFIKKGHKITLKNGSIAGSAIGVSFKGNYFSDTGQTNLSGTFVPLYGLNSLVSNIPILGNILTSRKSEGIIGLTYDMEGTFAEPDISINPLSALTPGILRRIFE